MKTRLWILGFLGLLVLAGCGQIPVTFSLGALTFNNVPLSSQSGNGNTVTVLKISVPSLPATPSKVVLSFPITQVQLSNTSSCGSLSSFSVTQLTITGSFTPPNSSIPISISLNLSGATTLTQSSGSTYTANPQVNLVSTLTGSQISGLLALLSQGGTITITSYTVTTTAPSGCTATMTIQAQGQATAYF
jgi:hypothetical protein